MNNYINIQDDINSINSINNINNSNNDMIFFIKNELNILDYNRIKNMKRNKRKLFHNNEENLIDSLLQKSIPKRISKIKITPDTFEIPSYKDYKWLLINDYNIKNLKEILKSYNKKISGNKDELLVRTYNYLYLSYNCIFIQKIFRKCLIKNYNSLHGPGLKNRDLCINNIDFCTMEKISDIPYNQFISYIDRRNNIYGFNILSIYNIYLQNKKLENPFTKDILDEKILTQILTYIRYSKLLKLDTNINFQQLKPIERSDRINLRIISIFHEINLLGNYSNSIWFNNLSKNSLILFLNELIDIWNYRANLLPTTKCEICPPNGNPFKNYIIPNMYTLSYNEIKKRCVNILDILVNTGINQESRGLGAYYILACLTLVNNDAAEAMPWLYQAVMHN
tara:strand:- start:119 stop:1303 length:1185 start_codon:yes stop_codon:yes gene_type:complete